MTSPIAEFSEFLSTAPSSFHAAQAAGAMLSQAGFNQQQETEAWDATAGGHFLIRDGAMMAWFIPETASKNSGFRIIGAHTDSPGFKLKFQPDIYSHGFNQANVEVYGGPILASWFDRELILAGVLHLKDGNSTLVSTPPLLRIPHLAIHLDRSANESLSIDRQRQLMPIWSVGDHYELMEYIAHCAQVEPSEILSHDLITAAAEQPGVFGADNQLLSAGRLDNLSSVYPALEAMVHAAAQPGNDDILVLAFFDHEEVGSASVTGAGGPILQDVLYRTAVALGADEDQKQQMLRRSSCVSADAAHSIHPNYPERHDVGNHPVLGAGPVLKNNANQRYASSAKTQALWLQACQQVGVNVQVFVGNNTVPCGSTIGPISATRLGIDTVDVGIPLLSMHSARELCHLEDLKQLSAVLAAYLVG